jgi:hypothetical protein
MYDVLRLKNNYVILKVTICRFGSQPPNDKYVALALKGLRVYVKMSEIHETGGV